MSDIIAPELLLGGKVSLFAGDNREVLHSRPDNSIDAIVTDPPYALVSIVKRFGKQGAAPSQDTHAGGAYARASAGFMGKQWDTGEVAFAVEFWAECLRVLKPGGHVVAFSGTRTYHRMVVAIEDAGFEIRDQLAWMYGSGFPKSHDVAKGIDKLDAVEEAHRRRVRFTTWMRSTGLTATRIDEITGTFMGSHYLTQAKQAAVATREMFEMLRPHMTCDVPAWVEQMVDERTVESENMKRREVVGRHRDSSPGTNMRNSLGGQQDRLVREITRAYSPEAQEWAGWGTALKPAWEPICLARKPLDGTVAGNVLAHGTGAINIDGCRVGDTGGTEFVGKRPGANDSTVNAYGDGLNGKISQAVAGLGRFPANVLHDGSAEILGSFPEVHGAGGARSAAEGSHAGGDRTVYGGTGAPAMRFGDAGGSAARFFYTAKADAHDRIGSKHPTVKPVDLMQWLVRLVTPKGGLVLDPFAGTGTTGEAAFREGMRAILIEREAEYLADIRRRMALALAGPDERARESIKAKIGEQPFEAGSLFAGLAAPEQAASARPLANGAKKGSDGDV